MVDRKGSERGLDYVRRGKQFRTYPSLTRLAHQRVLLKHRYYPEYEIFIVATLRDIID